jgi:hypothetical protein
MSDETESKVQAAATMMVAAAVTFTLKDMMMCLVLSTDEILDRSMQQRVRRMADKKRKKAPRALFLSSLPPIHLQYPRSRKARQPRRLHLPMQERTYVTYFQGIP